MKEKKVVHTVRLSFSEEFNQELEKTFNEPRWQCLRRMNIFIRHLVFVGLKEVVHDMEIERRQNAARLASAAGLSVPEYEPEPEPVPESVTDYWEWRLRPQETGVKAKIIAFPGRA